MSGRGVERARRRTTADTSTDGRLWVLDFPRIGEEGTQVNALDVQFVELYSLRR